MSPDSMQTQRLVGASKVSRGRSVLDARQETRRVNDACEAIATGDLRATIPSVKMRRKMILTAGSGRGATLCSRRSQALESRWRRRFGEEVAIPYRTVSVSVSGTAECARSGMVAYR